MLFFSLYSASYCLIEMVKSKKRLSHSAQSRQHLHPIEEQNSNSDAHRSPSVIASFLNKWYTILLIQDPEARIPLRVLIPVTIMCLMYVICRVYVYVEDIISLQEQPSSVYIRTDRLVWVFGA
jgi:hypothetical protein